MSSWTKKFRLADLAAVSAFIFLVALLFVGDYFIVELNIFAFWLVAAAGSIFFLRLNSKVILGALALYAPLFVLLISGVVYKELDPFYYRATVFVAVTITFLSSIEKNILTAPKWVAVFSMLMLLAFTIFGIFDDSGRSRSTVVFGPTILYRVILLFYAVCIIYLLPAGRKWLLVILSGVAFYCIIKIGSRGGLVSIIVMWLLILRRDIKLSPFAWAAVIAAGVLISFKADYILSSRAFYFSQDSVSSNVRLHKLEMIGEFLRGDELWFGMKNPHALVGNYPHNIFAEFLVFHGIFAFTLLACLCLPFFFSLIDAGRRRPDQFQLLLLATPILVGAQFSGSLLDNYSFVAIACYASALSLRGRRASVPLTNGAR